MKQQNLFGEEFEEKIKSEYTSKINIPAYEPKNRKPFTLELYDVSKSNRLINEIRNADILEEEKAFLIEAAKRHTVFNYSKIADYYAHASKEMQELMEKSALVIIDFEKAIQLGYIKLSEEIMQQYIADNG